MKEVRQNLSFLLEIKIWVFFKKNISTLSETFEMNYFYPSQSNRIMLMNLNECRSVLLHLLYLRLSKIMSKAGQEQTVA